MRLTRIETYVPSTYNQSPTTLSTRRIHEILKAFSAVNNPLPLLHSFPVPSCRRSLHIQLKIPHLHFPVRVPPILPSINAQNLEFFQPHIIETRLTSSLRDSGQVSPVLEITPSRRHINLGVLRGVVRKNGEELRARGVESQLASLVEEACRSVEACVDDSLGPTA